MVQRHYTLLTAIDDVQKAIRYLNTGEKETELKEAKRLLLQAEKLMSKSYSAKATLLAIIPRS
jgi:hypothetical protein